jgi:UDP-glucose:(heptosyl)LPS alpha-1,3-glucosyltransferase
MDNQTKTVVISQKNLAETFSGVPKKVHEEIRYFASHGCRVYAVAEQIDKRAVTGSGGIPVKTIRLPFGGYLRRTFYMHRTERFIKKVEPDIVIGHGDIVHQDILFIHNCVHLTYELVNNASVPKDHEVAKLHEQILNSRNFKALVCNSELMKNDLSERFSIDPDCMHVIHPEADPKKFKPEDRDNLRNLKREELGINRDETVIGLITSGNFKKRNADLLIDTAQILKQEPFKILIAGKNRDPQYRKRAEDLGLGNIIFVPSIPDVEKYYHAIDIFMLPAHIEEFGRSVLEAMMCGVPVVVSSMTGAGEILEGEARDFVMEEKTPEAYAAAIKKLAQDSKLRNRLGKANAQTALSYTAEKQREKFDSLIKKYGFLDS